MTRAGIFDRPGTATFEAVSAGVRQIGLEPYVQVPNCWTPESATRGLDPVIVVGLTFQLGAAAAHYKAAGAKVILLDLPHLRVAGQHRVTPADHTWLPSFDGEAPLDRLEALSVATSQRKRVKGLSILLVGQRSGDSAHGMNGAAFRKWASETLAALRSLTESKVVWRPHPKDPWILEGADSVSLPAEEPLAAAFDRCWAVVTYNSTAGLEALIAGLPVIAEGPAVYSSLAWKLAQFSRLAAPEPEALTDLLAALAYTQWTLPEIASGRPFRIILDGGALPGRPAVSPSASTPSAPLPDLPTPPPALAPGAQE